MDAEEQAAATDFEPIADGDVVAVVTFLEMASRPDSPVVVDSPLSLERREAIAPDEYRRLFRIAGERWLWFSRLLMSDGQLSAIIADSNVEIYAIIGPDGGESGLLELDFRSAGECEIAFVGLAPDLAGKGHGRWLMAETVRRAWREGIERVHVHTCSLDHPAALKAYMRAGFTAYRRAIERFRDPRLLGVIPVSAAPQVPLLGTDGSSTSEPPVS